MANALVTLFWIIAYSVVPGGTALKLLMRPCSDVCNVQADATMNIRCSLPNGVTAFSFDWYLFNGTTKIDHKTETNQIYTETSALSELNFHASKEHHGWNLYCSATTTLGELEYQKSTLNVLFPPTELVLSMDGSRLDSTTLRVVNANNVSIECRSDGYPPPTIRWEYGLNIYNGSFLTITNMQPIDAGTYMCVVENTMTPTFGPETIGRSNLSIQLKVQEIAVANKRNVELQDWKGRQRTEDSNDIVENPMYISADDVLANEHSASQDDVVENPMYISADDIGQKKVAQQANANGQVGLSKIYSIPYDVHKVDPVVDEEDNHYAEIID